MSIAIASTRRVSWFSAIGTCSTGLAAVGLVVRLRRSRIGGASDAAGTNDRSAAREVAVAAALVGLIAVAITAVEGLAVFPSNAAAGALFGVTIAGALVAIATLAFWVGPPDRPATTHGGLPISVALGIGLIAAIQVPLVIWSWQQSLAVLGGEAAALGGEAAAPEVATFWVALAPLAAFGQWLVALGLLGIWRRRVATGPS